MSGFAGFEVPGSLTENSIADQKAQNEATKKLLNAMVAQAVAAAGPDPRLTQITGGPNALNYLPFTGAVEQATGFGTGLVDALGNLRNAATGRNDDWHLPGMDTARKLGENFNKTTDEIQQQVGQHTPLTAPDPNSEMDQVISALGGVAGMGIPIAPSGAGKVLNMLPSVPRYVAKLLLPTAEDPVGSIAHSMAIAPPLVGVSAAAQAADEARANQDAGATQPLPTDQVAATTKPGVATDAPVAMPSFSAALKATQQPAANQNLPSFNEAYYGKQSDTQVPMQQEQGISKVPIWGPLATLATTLALVGAGKAFHGRNAETTQAGRDARYSDPAYVQQAQDWNNQQMARRGAIELSQGQTTPPPPPLPINDVRNKTNLANNETLNSNARGEMITRDMGDPSVANALANEYGVVNSHMAASTRVGEFRATGYHPDTGVQIPPPDRVLRNIVRMDPNDQRIQMEGLSAANELDNRDKNRKAFAQANPGQVAQAEDIRHDHVDRSDAQLQAVVDAMMADPIKARNANDLWAGHNGVIEIGRRMGFFTDGDAAKILADHPHYIPEVDATGQLMHVMGARDISNATGVRDVNTEPWIPAQKHIEELFRKFEQNDFDRRNMDSLYRSQESQPTAAKIITPAPVPPQATSDPFQAGGRYREPVAVIRTRDGIKAWRVAHPDILNMFTNDSLKAKHIGAEAMTIPRRIYQWNTTGPGSVVTGSLNALRNLKYGNLLLPINAPKGSYGGIIHKGVTRATGGRWDSGVARGLDIATYPATTAYAYGRGVVDRRAHNLADFLHYSNKNPINTWLRNKIGDASVDGAQKAFEKFYHDSFTARLAQRGASNMGIPARADLPSLNISSNKAANFAAARSVPEAFYGGQWRGTKPFLFKLNRAVSEALGHLSDAGHVGWARLNEDNPNMGKWAKTLEMRRLTGDPGVSGANSGLKYASGLLPYANISVQGTTRLARSFGERPLNASVAAATALGTLALIQQLTAMRSPAHMAHYQNALSTQQHEANFQFYTDPDPNKYTAVEVAQELRPFKALMDQLVAHTTNIVAQQHDPLTFHSVENMIKDFLGGHISTATWDQIKHGVTDITDVVNLPPWAAHVDQYKMIQGQGLWQSITSPWASLASKYGNQGAAPDQVPEGMLDDADGKAWTKVIGSIFGMAGTAVADFGNNVSRYAHQTGSWVDALGKGGRDWMFNAAEKNPTFNMVLEHQMRASLQPPIVERTEREVKWMQGITGSRTAPAVGDFTGRNRNALEVYPTQEHKIPTDPTMLYLWQTIEGANRSIAQPLADISALRKQMGSVQNQGMDPATRREWMNAATRRLADKYRFVHDVIEDTNTTMSKALNRPVRIGQSIKWQEGPEQFD